MCNVSRRTAYNRWHQRNYRAGPEHDDASSRWYQLVREYLGDVAGLRVLEISAAKPRAWIFDAALDIAPGPNIASNCLQAGTAYGHFRGCRVSGGCGGALKSKLSRMLLAAASRDVSGCKP
jgi:hypothetical protein